jgi:hypothetical protein
MAGRVRSASVRRHPLPRLDRRGMRSITPATFVVWRRYALARALRRPHAASRSTTPRKVRVVGTDRVAPHPPRHPAADAGRRVHRRRQIHLARRGLAAASISTRVQTSSRANTGARRSCSKKAYLILLIQELIERGCRCHFVATHGDYMESTRRRLRASPIAIGADCRRWHGFSTRAAVG